MENLLWILCRLGVAEQRAYRSFCDRFVRIAFKMQLTGEPSLNYDWD